MQKEMTVMMSVSDIRPYEKNPRKNQDAVKYVKNSIEEFGFNQPIVVDDDYIIIAGHTRWLAAKELGMKEIPVLVASHLSKEQAKAYRLADNKTAEFAMWDEELLKQELEEIMNVNMAAFGFEEGYDVFADEIEDSTYTMKSNIPQYEITGDCPSISEMLDKEKSKELIAEIEKAEGITGEERQFLKDAAGRHNVFNYRNIAEYYAHANPVMQRLMEKSALVIIDIDNAIANGYAALFSDVLDVMDGTRTVTRNAEA